MLSVYKERAPEKCQMTKSYKLTFQNHYDVVYVLIYSPHFKVLKFKVFKVFIYKNILSLEQCASAVMEVLAPEDSNCL